MLATWAVRGRPGNARGWRGALLIFFPLPLHLPWQAHDYDVEKTAYEQRKHYRDNRQYEILFQHQGQFGAHLCLAGHVGWL